MDDQVIEQHPWRHDWYFATDEVTRRRRRSGEPAEFTRHEKCTQCPTELRTRIDARRWEQVGHKRYVYAKGVKILRVSRAEHLRRTIAKTTDNPEILALAQAQTV